MEDECLVAVGASSHSSLLVGSDVGTRMPASYQVLESGSSLALADAQTHPAFGAARTLGGARFFVGVPLRAPSGVPVGVVCVYDRTSRTVEAEDLSILQLFGRAGSARLELLSRGGHAPARLGSGVWARSSFEAMLDAELRLFEIQGGTLVLAMTEVGDIATLKSALARSQSRERLSCSSADDARVLVCKRAHDDGAGAAVRALLADLRAHDEARAVGMIDLAAGGLHPFAASDLARLAMLAFERALESGGGVFTLRLHADAQPLLGCAI
jgi:hypothetical protein